MSKAFTLFELIISLILFTFITSLLSKPLMDFYHLNFTALHTNNLITQAHLNLLKIEKLIQNCINITFSQNTLKCLLKDELISLKDNKLYLINSALILENNHTLYSPHSDFKTQLQNRKDLYNDNEHISYAYKINKIEKISILENGISANFTGSFIPLQAQLVIKLQNEELIYEIKPKFNEQLNQQGLISKNISSFNLQNNKLKICLKRQTKHCLEKRILL
ncbi:hypothetical protein Q6T70_000255 [Campylobacter jejuni]|uniref:Periplasmic protein n=3 Tax=Campylobacter jejuni TaxID=197 RepID=Q0P9H6_CAMJE|nr:MULTISPECIES: hypothetical protein [Campylobacter]YP_002344471.1 periplasmic protein [Campylobacter jejuni subsp. jejuni NCTC 11168 = ATCC 700819]APA81324.1 Putative periplasmic protein [Campylobacter jejuni subsp. jejuni D42a]EAJ6189464.1 hypothetical protein [Campylobacter fetus]EFV07341.1 prepilin-type N-terminal cleavage/methylation domain protein [Campylobacter jejuni subsp. jejuni DFVF1099]EFV08445.1 putative periplasmic protein [Campylobacter jejuni subsp. jejuni 305]UBN62818.1 hypo